jgi:hypothetical protein
VALEGRVKLGALTLNEMRGALGLDPFQNAAADRPMVLTATGYVPIEANAGGEGASNQTPPTAADKPSLIKDYDPDQPRVSAGNPDGGRWTSANGAGTTVADGADSPSSTPSQQVISDASPDPIKPGAEYAQNTPAGGGRRGGSGYGDQPSGQAARLDIA